MYTMGCSTVQTEVEVDLEVEVDCQRQHQDTVCKHTKVSQKKTDIHMEKLVTPSALRAGEIIQTVTVIVVLQCCTGRNSHAEMTPHTSAGCDGNKHSLCTGCLLEPRQSDKQNWQPMFSPFRHLQGSQNFLCSTDVLLA